MNTSLWLIYAALIASISSTDDRDRRAQGTPKVGSATMRMPMNKYVTGRDHHLGRVLEWIYNGRLHSSDQDACFWNLNPC